MLTLLTFPPSFEMPSHSPFCCKAMALLRMSGEAWQPKYLSDPRKMPLGRLPVLRTQEGDLIPDSAHIQAFLETRGAAFNKGLSDADQARAHALIRMVEGSLSHGMAYERWLRDDCWPIVRAVFFAEMPGAMRRPVSAMIRRKVRKALASQGLAQFTPAQRLAHLTQDITAIDTTLGDKAYLLADHPTAADAATAPVLDMIRTLPCDTELRQVVRENTRLMGYLTRTRTALYPS